MVGRYFQEKFISIPKKMALCIFSIHPYKNDYIVYIVL